MSRECPLCAHPEREAIDASLRDAGLRPTLRRWPALKHTSTHKHRTKCLGLSGAVEGPPEDYRASMPPAMPTPPATGPDDSEATPAPAELVEPATGAPGPAAESPAGLALDIAAEDALTMRDRVRHVAGLIVQRRWQYGSVATLARLWGVDERTVRHYHAAAGVVLSLDAGTIEAQKQQALAETAEIRQMALDADAPDLRAAIAAQTHADRIRGLLTPSGPLVSVTVKNAAEEKSEIGAFLERLMLAIRPWPEAHAAAMAVAAEVAAERRAAVGILDVEGHAVNE